MQKQESRRQCPCEVDKIGREFDEDACDFCDRYQKTGLSRSSKLLLELITGEGVLHKSVIDLGCGAGGFSIELLKQGADTAAGFDLSQKMIDSANQLARSNGLESKATFEVGNAATVHLPPADIAIMDKVLCCYSQWEPLLSNVAGSTKETIGFIVPRDAGIVKWPFRLGVRVANFFQRRSEGVLFYLHPLNHVDRTLRELGFKRQKRQGSRFWLVFLYSRSRETESGAINQ